ncbi:putative acetyltransferase [Vibrio halioticoli NBRC 102217]|uniref:Putative acetyltransferase n=1 Tax=Vibrio halioticoli NBRC 102217 TaxID=1219072 RepID=V5HLE0_9VIBR|nr:GNAT family N-acetyltransferase [Vibrio halioticoli]GAD90005.1 putative acetyltransferase [Vibrio halioticoli NBRC 102217]
MTVRQVKLEDLEALVSLCEAHAEYEQLPFEHRDQVDRWKQALFSKTPLLHMWVYEEERTLLGYMSATIDFATWTGRPFVYMDCLFLQPEARRKGIGKQFIGLLRDFAEENNCSEIQWHTPPTNELGISFYRGVGADEKSKLRFFLNTDKE